MSVVVVKVEDAREDQVAPVGRLDPADRVALEAEEASTGRR